MTNRTTQLVLGSALLLLFGVHAYLTPHLSRQTKGPESATPAAPALGTVHHDLRITLSPEDHTLRGTDRLVLPPGRSAARFILHRDLTANAVDPAVRLVKRIPATGPYYRYELELPPGTDRVELELSGSIFHAIEQYGEDFARKYGASLGMIAPDGVYLTGASGWYPAIEGPRVTFALEVTLPAGWSSVSQGRRTRRSGGGGANTERWEVSVPQEGIYLLAGPWHEYAAPAVPGVDALVMLREPDPDLAQTYLDATGRYVGLYTDLIGPYPYGKFALVENFWETGYGMPSFTLLGPKVIRLPFILESSYPHEILHNWWGNGVFVDYSRGNWCEGLTAYLSDHLFQELKGRGAEHRLTSLQKYADYVSEARDFPLRAFTSRHGSASEAVGYTKMMMFSHMLRREFGDSQFTAALRRFYADHRYRTAGFGDLRKAFEETTGRPLGSLFEQWVERAGAPRLEVAATSVAVAANGYRLTTRLRQTQQGAPYRLRVPLAITLEGRAQAWETEVEMEGAEMEAELFTTERPLRLDVDPRFDLFRRLLPQEMPPALSMAFGAERILVVLPGAATDTTLQAYRQLAETWSRADPARVKVRLDDQLAELPAGQAVWLFGWENRFLPTIRTAVRSHAARLGQDTVELPDLAVPRADHAVALAVRDPDHPETTVAWFATAAPGSVAGLGRRLPHYHKYSYLAFGGETMENLAKGRWTVNNSPLSAVLVENEGGMPVTRAALPPRPPLVALP